MRDLSATFVDLQGVLQELDTRVSALERGVAGSADSEMTTLQRIIDEIPVGVLLVDVRTRRVAMVNDHCLDLFRMGRSKQVGQPCGAFACPGNTDCPVLDRGLVVRGVEREILTGDGERKAVMKSVDRIQLGGQEYLLETFQDISDRKRANEALERTRAELHQVFEVASNGMCVVDPQGRVSRVNSAYLVMLGLDREDIVGQPCSVGLAGPRCGTPECSLVAARHGNHTLQQEIRTRSDGRPLHLVVRTSDLRDEEGRFQALLKEFHDITDTVRAREALQESEERFRSIATAALDATIMMDAEARVAFWNASAERIFGYSSDEIMGRDLHTLLSPPALRRRFLDAWERFKASGTGAAVGKTLELTALHKQGHPFPIEISLAALRMQGAWWAVAHIRDITDRKAAEAQLTEAKERAERAVATKSQFLANMSHEIRTPMNAILGLTRLTLESGLDDEQHENLDIVLKSAEALLALIDDILDFSKIEAGRMDLESIDFDVQALMDGVTGTLGLRAEQKGLELLSLVEADVPRLLRGDPTRLRQVLMNLVGNAIKFTAKGEVSLGVEVVEVSGERATIKFSVCDTGVGIAADKLEQIFEAFSQADGSTTRQFGGTGLGLTISRQIVGMMGGRLDVESELGKGSRFMFTAPFERQTGTALPHAHLSGDIAGYRLLVVDDNSANRMVFEKTLRPLGATVAAVNSGEDGIAELRRAVLAGEPYDAVLLDMAMPGMDGEDTARRIHGDLLLKGHRIIILTSIGERGEVKSLQRYGVRAYLTKPVRTSQLVKAIQATLSQPQQSDLPVITRHSLLELFPDKPHVLLVEDNPFNQKVAVKYLQRLGLQVSVAENGEQALNAVEGTQFRMVFMDVSMPVMDGLEATRRLREREREAGSRLPVVAMTAHAVKGDKERCLQAGMDDYLSKPFAEEELEAVVRRWLSPAAEAVQPASPAPAVDLPVPVREDLYAVWRMFGDEPDFLQELTVLYGEDCRGRIERLRTLLMGELAADAGAVVHALKGAAGNFGQANLAAVYSLLEEALQAGDLEQAAGRLAQATAHFEALMPALEKRIEHGLGG